MALWLLSMVCVGYRQQLPWHFKWHRTKYVRIRADAIMSREKANFHSPPKWPVDLELEALNSWGKRRLTHSNTVGNVVSHTSDSSIHNLHATAIWKPHRITIFVSPLSHASSKQKIHWQKTCEYASKTNYLCRCVVNAALIFTKSAPETPPNTPITRKIRISGMV